MDETDELRRLLDERGIKYETGFGSSTLWTGKYGVDWCWEEAEGALVTHEQAITPEEAIDITLGNKGATLSDETLQKDNARLRKLLRDFIEFCINGGGYKDCPFKGEVNGVSCNLLEEARGLGVEFDFKWKRQ